METDVIVFQEERFHFGIKTDEFSENFSLDAAWISPEASTDRLWHYENKNGADGGDFIHFGALLGLTSAYFNNASQIFMKNVSDRQALGACVSGTLFGISLKQGKYTIQKIDETVQIPGVLPQTIFSGIIKYNRKPIYIVDPILLFRAFDLIERDE